MASLSLKHIFKVYDGNVKAVNDFCMDIEDKEFIVFVGPSGCGKSTTLRMIAGLEEITAGELQIDGEIVNDVEPKDRNIAMVFQNYALYPHMSVYENMAFALRTARVPKDIIHEKVTEAAEILGITEYLERKPKALSGGQRQRVALGRAIVRQPKVFLLDEPLSNLDAKLRAAMRSEISRLHQRLGTTFIYVTHDQVEAMTMGTRIVVMRDGFVQQIDSPMNLYRYPDNMFVAGFIGTPQMNFFEGVINKRGDEVRFSLDCGAAFEMSYSFAEKIPVKYMDGKSKVIFGVRPEDLRIARPDATDSHLWSRTKAVVSVVEVLGNEVILYANLNVQNPDDKKGAIIVKTDPDFIVHPGDVIDVEVSRRKFHVFDKETEKSIKKRIPEQNIVNVDIVNNTIRLAEQSFAIPSAIVVESSHQNVELVMPISALTIGRGVGKARIHGVEQIEDKTLYTLDVNGSILFSLKDGEPEYGVGDDVSFDIDMCKIAVADCGIDPMNTVNSIDGEFTKAKISRKEYQFYMQMAGHKLVPNVRICEKLFSCKGTRIFKTPLNYSFDACAVTAKPYNEGDEVGNALIGKVVSIKDYGHVKYATCDCNGTQVVAAYDGQVGDTLALEVNVDMVTIKDKTIDIIIV